jgi:ribonuclease HII
MTEKKISEIQKEYKEASIELLPDFIEEYINDGRPGVSKIIGQAQKKMEKLRVEKERIKKLKEYEYKYWDKYQYIGGIDEVGRGPLAGPVVTACVVLPGDCDILYSNDSKKLSAAKREELYETIMRQAVSVSIGVVSEKRIDEINILQATYEAMRQAISECKVQPQVLLNDAVNIPGVDIKQVPIIKGDAKSITIGAASIIAKVTRDRMMEEYDSIYPEYHFASNKGYGSAEHIAALKKYGPCPIHRRSFIGNFV